MKKALILLIAFITTCLILKAQAQDNKIDSLLQVYEQAENDTTRIQLLINIGDIYENEIPDTAINYYLKSLEIIEQIEASDPPNFTILNNYQKKILSLKAKSHWYIGIVQKNKGSYEQGLDNCLTSLQTYDQLGDKNGKSNCYNTIGLINSERGFYDMALQNFYKALEIEAESGDLRGMSRCYINIGVVFFNQGNFDKALEYYFNTLKIAEEFGDKRGIADSYNNIGMVHDKQGSSNKAKEYYLKSLEIEGELGNKNGTAESYNNLGNIYHSQGSYNKALEYYFKSLQIEEELGNKNGMAISYNNIGIIYTEQGKYNRAYEYYLKSLNIDQELGDKGGIAYDYGIIADLHIMLADRSKSQDINKWSTHLNTAINYAFKAYELALEINVVPMQNDAASHLQKAYTKLGQYKEALKYSEIYIATQDSMFSEEKTKALTEMTAKYEAEKKQLQIEKMEKQKELDDKTIEAQQAQNRKQLIIIFSAIGAFLTVLFFSIIILRMLGQKRKANTILANQNIEINQQKEKIEEQNRNITDSIVYAQRIQQALLPPGDYMKQLLPQRFVLYKPRDIVSGDFYWISKKDDVVITATADCTGHGVPGAMMSMLGVSILNEIVNNIQKEDAGEILNKLRDKLIKSLHPGGQKTEMWDGMDIAICLINIEKQQVQFAGAYSPLYIIREGELIEIKGDKMPIGIHAKMDNFTNNILELQQDDLLYTFSDGYIDQFGGEDDKRFTQGRFKKLLLEIHKKPMPEQKKELERTLEEWQGKSDQIDDVLVMGVNI